MYADVKGASAIQAPPLKAKLKSELDRARDRATEKDCVFIKFTGDGLLACLTTCSDLADVALHLRDRFRNRNWRVDGFAEPPGIRIGLDFRSVTLHYDDTGKPTDGMGAGLDAASRIEPVTDVNEVFCSELFYKGLMSEVGENISGDYLGERALAKNAGSADLYRLRWRGEHGTSHPEPWRGGSMIDVQTNLYAQLYREIQSRNEGKAIFYHYSGGAILEIVTTLFNHGYDIQLITQGNQLAQKLGSTFQSRRIKDHQTEYAKFSKAAEHSKGKRGTMEIYSSDVCLTVRGAVVDEERQAKEVIKSSYGDMINMGFH